MAIKSPIREADHWFIGEDRTLDFYITENNLPLDCSGFGMAFALKRNAWDDTVIITKTTPSGITVENGDGTGDLVRVAILDTDTDALLSGWYFHTLRKTDPGSEVVLSFGPAYLGKAASP